MPSIEIVLPETKPETEWVRGRALQKVSPTYRHGITQTRIVIALSAWVQAFDAGRVATEWRFRITPPGARTRPLVPDVAFVSYADLPKSASDACVDVPSLAPTLVVEIRSPNDRTDDIVDKLSTYLAAGATAVLLVDPVAKVADVHDRNGVRVLGCGDTFVHDALPGFALDLSEVFAP